MRMMFYLLADLSRRNLIWMSSIAGYTIYLDMNDGVGTFTSKRILKLKHREDTISYGDY